MIMNKNELMARFSDITRIKKGGQKIVYKAKLEGTIVALKIINDATDRRVQQEITLVNSLNLNNVPHIIESGVVYDDSISEDVLYIIEEYLDGISLRDWLNSGNRFNLKQAYDVLHTILDIEIELEKNGILHRDINPNSIILAKDGNTYLIDFGLAKDLNGASLTLTAANYGPFTPGYAPQEQFSNLKNSQDVRTDLFSIGVTIYEACTGRNPFRKENDVFVDILTKTANLIPPRLTLSGDKLGYFSQYINMMMAKSQSQRPNTAVDAKRYLEAIKDSLELGVL
ncbi:serine/threonine-protein kinase [Ruminococcus bicirculans (ex Wegman et al. 2014)]|uniref:serine/threonine-protein kinase n=1 Tax=Ruminococcus bicirculans (ex Wegman et al. 2014) TaxID=1160721 RepID=UPI00399B24A2